MSPVDAVLLNRHQTLMAMMEKMDAKLKEQSDKFAELTEKVATLSTKPSTTSAKPEKLDTTFAGLRPPLLPHMVAQYAQEPVRARGTSAALPSAERRLAATARPQTPPHLRVPPPRRQHAHHDHLLAQEPPIIQEREEESDHRLPSLEMTKKDCPGPLWCHGEAGCERIAGVCERPRAPSTVLPVPTHSPTIAFVTTEANSL